MPLSGATPARGAGALNGGCYTVALVSAFTTSTGAVAETYGQTGFSLGSFTSGVATLTFPKSFKFLEGRGVHNTDDATASSRFELVVRDVDLAAGTAVVRLVEGDAGATDSSHTAPTGVLKLVLTVGE